METIKGPAAQGSDSGAVRALGAARAKVAAGWTQHSDARDAAGRACCAEDPQAASWCLAGAILAAEPSYPTRVAAYRLLGQSIGPFFSVIAFNDAQGRKQAEVLAKLDQAIAIASEQPTAGPSAIPASPTSTDNEGDGECLMQSN